MSKWQNTCKAALQPFLWHMSPHVSPQHGPRTKNRAAMACLLGSLLQGRSPFPYALAELIDNALRATRHNQGARRIEVTLATIGAAGTRHSGYTSVSDHPLALHLNSVKGIWIFGRTGRQAWRTVLWLLGLGSAGAPCAGLISVWDSGCGMAMRELSG